VIGPAKFALLCVLLLAIEPALPGNDVGGIDADSGLIIAPGWETVKTNCTICHSARFITFQRGDRDSWASMIRWMQKTQGLWQFDEKTEDTILTYLAENYPPGKATRRKNLPPEDLPSVPSRK
jgi:hypothetical protein